MENRRKLGLKTILVSPCPVASTNIKTEERKKRDRIAVERSIERSTMDGVNQRTRLGAGKDDG